MSIVDDYGGAAHVDGCAYCRGRWRWRGDPWEWFAKPYSADRARFTWSREVAAAASVLKIPVHPVTHEGVFIAKRNWGRNSDGYVALPYCAEEALRHCQYAPPRALERLFRKLNDADVRAGAGAAFRLGGSFALRDYLCGEGAL